MTTVIIDPSEIRKFETALRKLSGDVNARRLDLERRVADVQKFWDDQKYKDFLRHHEKLMLEIQSFTKLSNLYCEFLQQKAAAADAYLGR